MAQTYNYGADNGAPGNSSRGGGEGNAEGGGESGAPPAYATQGNYEPPPAYNPNVEQHGGYNPLLQNKTSAEQQQPAYTTSGAGAVAIAPSAVTPSPYAPGYNASAPVSTPQVSAPANVYNQPSNVARQQSNNGVTYVLPPKTANGIPLQVRQSQIQTVQTVQPQVVIVGGQAMQLVPLQANQLATTQVQAIQPQPSPQPQVAQVTQLPPKATPTTITTYVNTNNRKASGLPGDTTSLCTYIFVIIALICIESISNTFEAIDTLSTLTNGDITIIYGNSAFRYEDYDSYEYDYDDYCSDGYDDYCTLESKGSAWTVLLIMTVYPFITALICLSTIVCCGPNGCCKCGNNNNNDCCRCCFDSNGCCRGLCARRTTLWCFLLNFILTGAALLVWSINNPINDFCDGITIFDCSSAFSTSWYAMIFVCIAYFIGMTILSNRTGCC